jgi:hypothetical protein
MADLTFQEQILNIQSQRSNLLLVLLEDSKNPIPSYSVGGQSVDRVAWRKAILDQIDGLNRLLRVYQPIEIRSIAI